MAERTWKYARVAKAKKNTMVSMGDAAACTESGLVMARMLNAAVDDDGERKETVSSLVKQWPN